jgi:hypothetical protein
MADIEKFIYYNNGSKKVLKPTDRVVISSGGLAFEGETDDNFETQFAVQDPTADRTVTFPDASGTVLLSDGSYTMPTSDGTSGQVLSTDGNGNISFSNVESGTQQRLYFQVNQNQSNPITLTAPSSSYFDALYNVNCATGFPFDLNVFTPNSVPSGFKITIKGGVVVNDVVTVKCTSGFVLQSNPSTISTNFKINRAGYTKTFISNSSLWYEIDENELSYSNDVYLSGRATNDILYWNGSDWQNKNLKTAVVENGFINTVFSSSTTLTASNNTVYICYTLSNNMVITLPSNSPAGSIIVVKRANSNNTVAIDPGVGSIDGSTNNLELLSGTESVTLVARGSFNQWYKIGSTY